VVQLPRRAVLGRSLEVPARTHKGASTGRGPVLHILVGGEAHGSKCGVVPHMELRRDVACPQVEDQTHRSGMLWRQAKVDAHPRPAVPLPNLVPLLELVIQDVGGAAEGVEMFEVGRNPDPSEALQW